MDIRFLGHAAFELGDGDTSVLIDPFLTGNPKAAVAADDLSPQAILLTHGHVDHIGDTVPIATRAGVGCGGDRGDRQRALRGGPREGPRPNLGGTVELRLGLGQARAGLAHLDDPQGHRQLPAGVIVRLAGKTIYHLGDTALFSDLRLIGETRAARSTSR